MLAPSITADGVPAPIFGRESRGRHFAPYTIQLPSSSAQHTNLSCTQTCTLAHLHTSPREEENLVSDSPSIRHPLRQREG